MKWNTEKRKLKDLIVYEKNPRILTNKQKSEIEKSLKKFDLVEIPAINTNNRIIAGHQRIKILSELKGGDYEIDVRVPDKELNEKDFQEYLLRSNKNQAIWDWTILESFGSDILLESGFEDFEVTLEDFNVDELFKDQDRENKKVKVDTCEFCKSGIRMSTNYVAKDLSKLNYPKYNDKFKKLYNYVKDNFGDDDNIEIIIVEK